MGRVEMEWRRLIRQPWTKDIALSLIVVLIIFLLSSFGLFESLEFWTLDLRFKMRGGQQPSNQIVIFLDKKLSKREEYAAFVVHYKEAAAIGFDFIFRDPKDEEGDMALEIATKIASVYHAFGKADSGPLNQESIAALERFAWECEPDCKDKLVKVAKIATPLARFSTSARGVGHVIKKSSDKLLRRIPLLIEHEGKCYPLLGLQIVCDVLGVAEKKVRLGRYIELTTNEGRKIKIPIDEKGGMLIDYTRKFDRDAEEDNRCHFDNFYCFFFDLDNLPTPDDPPNTIILVGGDEDKHRTPFCCEYRGVGVHATVIDQILREDFLKRGGNGTNVTIYFLLGLLGTAISAVFLIKRITVEENAVDSDAELLGKLYVTFKGAVWIIVLVITYLATAVILFRFRGFWINIAAPVAVLVSIYVAYNWMAILKVCLAIGVLVGYFLLPSEVGERIPLHFFAVIYILFLGLIRIIPQKVYKRVWIAVNEWLRTKVGGD